MIKTLSSNLTVVIICTVQAVQCNAVSLPRSVDSESNGGQEIKQE